MEKQMAKAKKNSRIVNAGNIHDVPDSGGSAQLHIPEGIYKGIIEEVTQTVSSNDNDMLTWIIKITSPGKGKNKKIYTYTVFTDSSLWKLKQYLTALEIPIPKGPMEIDLDDLEGREVTFEVVDGEYQGKPRSEVARFISNGEEEEEDEETEEEEEEEPVSKKKKGIRAKAKNSKPSGDEINEMDEEELEGVVQKFDLDVDLTEFRTLRRKASAVIAALQE
jgi:hypothetical protein